MAAAKKSQPTEAADENSKTVTLKSPWGSKVIVPADAADLYKDAGFTSTK